MPERRPGSARRPTLHVTHVITRLDRGGAQEVLVHLLAESSLDGVTSDVVVLGERGPVADRVEATGAAVTAFSAALWQAPLVVARLTRHLRRTSTDVVLAWLYHAEVVATLAARRAGVPVAWSVHHTDLDADHWPWHTRVAARVADRLASTPGAIVYASPSSRRVHEARGRPAQRGVVVPNGLPLPVAAPDARPRIRAELGIPEGAPVAVRVARAHPQKDLPAFVTAIAHARRRVPDLRAIIAGAGTESDRPVDTVIRRHGLADVVHRLGARDDVADLHAAADVAVSSSSSGEAMPMALLEALAMGLPVVTTDVGDAGTIVGDAGVTVPPRDPAALGDAVATVAALSPERRAAMGQRGRARVAEEHDVATMAGRYLDVLRTVAGPRHGPAT